MTTQSARSEAASFSMTTSNQPAHWEVLSCINSPVDNDGWNRWSQLSLFYLSGMLKEARGA